MEHLYEYVKTGETVMASSKVEACSKLGIPLGQGRSYVNRPRIPDYRRDYMGADADDLPGYLDEDGETHHMQLLTPGPEDTSPRRQSV